MYFNIIKQFFKSFRFFKLDWISSAFRTKISSFFYRLFYTKLAKNISTTITSNNIPYKIIAYRTFYKYFKGIPDVGTSKGAGE